MITLFRKKKSKPAVEQRSTPRTSAPEEKGRAAESIPTGKERRFIGVVIAPHLTEKSSQAQGWYTFRVASAANKIIVKRAVQERYGVAVEKVRMLNQPQKHIRLGRIEGRVPGWKKAMVKVKAGQTIEFV